MVSDVFINVAIVASFLFLIGQIFRNNDFNHKQSYKKQIIIGGIFGVLGVLLMTYTIDVMDTVIIDLRNLSIISAGILGGPISAALAALSVAVFRISHFGINTASVTAFFVALILGSACAAISIMRSTILKKFIYMLFFAMIISSTALVYLIKDISMIVDTIIFYWVIYLGGGALSYLALKYIISAGTVFRSMEYSELMFDNLVDMISTHRIDGTYIKVSSSINLTGYTSAELEGKSYLEFAHPDDIERIKATISQHAAQKDYSAQIIHRFKRKDRRYIWVETLTRNVNIRDDSVTRIVCTTRDITLSKMTEMKLVESEELFRAAFDSTAIGMAIVTAEGFFIRVNQALCNILGYTEDEIIPTSLLEMSHPDDLNTTTELIRKSLDGDISYYHVEKRYVHKDGHTIWAFVSSSLVRDASGSPKFFICQVQDITARKLADEELKSAKAEVEKMAFVDYLTGVMSRRAFIGRFNEEFLRVGREKSTISLILTDIDNFKYINDNFGHQVGDLTLRKFADCLSNICRPYDFIGRHGGEEFLICLPNTNCEQAVSIAERMRKAVEQMDIHLPRLRNPIRITASFGVASPIKGDEESIDSLIMLADKAMYRAKASGKNKVCPFSQEK